MAKTILIADDNDDLRSILGYQLQQAGYRVLMAPDGGQAIEKARQEKPDLIILDVLMPGLDGTEAASSLKVDPVTARIPVIFLTALIQGNEPSATEEGVTFPKSTDSSFLLSKIRELLEKTG